MSVIVSSKIIVWNYFGSMLLLIRYLGYRHYEIIKTEIKYGCLYLYQNPSEKVLFG